VANGGPPRQGTQGGPRTAVAWRSQHPTPTRPHASGTAILKQCSTQTTLAGCSGVAKPASNDYKAPRIRYSNPQTV
jgi:hypothetical protein